MTKPRGYSWMLHSQLSMEGLNCRWPLPQLVENFDPGFLVFGREVKSANCCQETNKYPRFVNNFSFTILGRKSCIIIRHASINRVIVIWDMSLCLSFVVPRVSNNPGVKFTNKFWKGHDFWTINTRAVIFWEGTGSPCPYTHRPRGHSYQSHIVLSIVSYIPTTWGVVWTIHCTPIFQ